MQLFDSTTLTEVSNRDRLVLDEYYEMLAKDPTARAGVKGQSMAFLAMFGEFQHPEAAITEFISNTFTLMNGTFQKAVIGMSLYSALGVQLIPLEIQAIGVEWHLERLLPLDLRRSSFEGKQGDIEQIKFRTKSGTNNIPYNDVMHLVYDDELTPDHNPWGVPECKAALAAHKAKKAALGNSMQIAQVQATNNMHAQVSEVAVPIVDETGTPTGETRPRQDVVREALELLKDTGVIITGKDDLLSVLNTEAKPDFLQWWIELLDRMILLAFLLPETHFSVGRGGLGNVTISEQHNAVFQEVVKTKVDYVRESFINCIIKPLIEYNFGVQADGNYGKFQVTEEKHDNAVEIANAISDAVVKGAVPALWLPQAQARLAEVLGFNVDADELLDANNPLIEPPEFGDNPPEDA